MVLFELKLLYERVGEMISEAAEALVVVVVVVVVIIVKGTAAAELVRAVVAFIPKNNNKVLYLI